MERAGLSRAQKQDIIKLNMFFPYINIVPVFWDITPCTPVNVNHHFNRTYHVHLRGRRISEARKYREVLGILTEDEGDIFIRNVSLLLSECMVLYSRRRIVHSHHYGKI
jgi:hypothetical protein